MTSSVIVDIFLSVDGFAGSDGLPAYFGYPGPELAQWVDREARAPQTVLLGRRTYQLMAGLPEELRDEGWRHTSRQHTVVFSTSLQSSEWPNTRICPRDPALEVAGLKQQGSTLRTVGSLSIGRRLMDAGLVDRLRLMTFPLLAGESGREPFFDRLASADLELADHQVLDGRILLTEYRPTGRPVPRA